MRLLNMNEPVKADEMICISCKKKTNSKVPVPINTARIGGYETSGYGDVDMSGNRDVFSFS